MVTSTTTICETRDCAKGARMAFATTRPTRANVWTRIWWDDREAPKSAARHCKKHGIQALAQIADVLIDLDEDEEVPVQDKGQTSTPTGLARPCPVCNAQTGQPCTQPTSTGRQPVRWLHLKRVDE